MKATLNNIKQKLEIAGLVAVVSIDESNICVEAEDDSMARDVLGMERFRDMYQGVEVIIISL